MTGINFGTTATIFQNKLQENYEGHYSCVRYYETNNDGIPEEFPVKNERLARVAAADFKKIPGAPVAYWISDRAREVFDEHVSLGDVVEARQGLATGDNDRFLRLWWEVSQSDINYQALTKQEAFQSGRKWFPHNKAGQFRKWYGNQDYLIAFDRDTYNVLKTMGNHCPSEGFYFRPSVSWSEVTSGRISFRKYPAGFIFNNKGMSAFPNQRCSQEQLLALCNNTFTVEMTRVLNPSLSFGVGDFGKLPAAFLPHERIIESIGQLVRIAELDWDEYETSWNFTTLLLLQSQQRGTQLNKAYVVLRWQWHSVTLEMQRLEKANNQLFIESYDLENEFASDVPLSEVTLTCNPHYRYGSSSLKSRNWSNLCDRFPETCERLAQISLELAHDMPEEDRLGLEQRLLEDTMKEFISYAVGCMFGRYSLDKPGLVLANQGETLQDYVRQVPDPTFMPDEDNVIPMLDGDWFPDDVSERFKTFLRVTFGEAHYEENLAFIELALNRDVRGYFLRNFYDDHVRTYSKRPIYWLFSSPNGSFNALVYMHRYRPDTVSIVLNDYLREFRTKLKARRRHLEHVERSAETTQRDKTQAVKEMTRIDKVLNELRAYEDEVLYPLATRQVEIDLDDGVLVNYNKLGKALAHVSSLSGKV